MQLTTHPLDALATKATNGHAEANGKPADVPVPRAPKSIADCGVDREVLENLALKLAYTVPRFTTDWAARRLCLPLALLAELLEQLRVDRLIEILGQAGPFSHHFSISERGRERALRLMEISGYVGPAPVSLAAYSEYMDLQFSQLPEIGLDRIKAAFSELVLSPEAMQVAGLAALSRRSLFLHGPAGNGKTTLAHLLHDAMFGNLWIPYCIAFDQHIIRVYDSACHEPAESDSSHEQTGVDQRWIRIRPPFIVVGGELSVDALDLTYSHSLGYYQAPLHMKANGGIFLLDDFGCQRVSPQELLNRWIHPLERQVDLLTLRSGQQIKVPFRQMFVVATNLDPEKVMTQAFLRRMGYRVYLDDPSSQQYVEIFRRYAARCGVKVPEGLIDTLLRRHCDENRPLRGCEPRDLIERSRDMCRLRGQSLELCPEVVDVAWMGYFGNR